jgi:hydrophobe/amphiphile efflux-3 (HAE3) family protein
LTPSESFSHWILSHRSWVAIALVIGTLVAAAGIYDPIARRPRIRIDPSLNEMLPADDPARRFYEELLERFGSDDVVFLSLRSDSLFSPDGLAALERVTLAVERADGVHHVEGLANAVRLRSVDDDLEISGFLESLPRTQAEADLLRADVLEDPLRAGTFVSSDGTATGILVTFDRMPEDVFLEQSFDLQVLEIARAAAPEMRIMLAGTPHIKAEVGRLLTKELTLMVPIVFGLMSILSSLFFRSVRVGMVPIAAVGLGLVWTVGVMGWVGHDLNIVTTLIPPLILALGFAYATHVVASFQTLSGEDRAERALARVAFPVMFTALTTVAGFLSLLTNGLDVIRGFGVFSAVSTGATLLAALTLVPLLLSGKRSSAMVAVASESSWLDRRLIELAGFDVRHANAILIGAFFALALSVWAATKIEVNLPVIENFGRDTEIRQAYEEVDRLFGGANQFYVMLRADEVGAFERPETLREVSKLQDWLVEQPEIGGTTSVVQYIEVLNEVLGPEAVPTRRIPESENLIAQLLLFGANEELDVLLDRAHQVITIMVRSTATATQEFELLGRRIDGRLAELPEGITGHTTGNAILLTRAANQISRGQVLSLLAAAGMIGLMLIFYFRSVRLGLYALIPNLLPVMLYFGLLGATGTTLNNSTALMGSIVLGIATDDTLHLLVEYRRALRKNDNVEEALRHALTHVGRAITCTTMAVCVGLLVVGGSELKNQAEFGLLGAATLAIAWLVDITVTPALCLRLIRKA